MEINSNLLLQLLWHRITLVQVLESSLVPARPLCPASTTAHISFICATGPLLPSCSSMVFASKYTHISHTHGLGRTQALPPAASTRRMGCDLWSYSRHQHRAPHSPHSSSFPSSRFWGHARGPPQELEAENPHPLQELMLRPH